MSVLSAANYAAISEFLQNQAGIHLGAGKEYLVSSRLLRLMQKNSINTFDDLINGLNKNTPMGLRTQVVDAMTTNETFWFRDAGHYTALIDSVLPECKGRARIWSAAASTGQEAYSIGISIQDAQREGKLPRSLSYEIVGTDISPSALERAKEAHYTGVSTGRGLTEEQRQRYFKVDAEGIELLPQYRQGISFRVFNLMDSFITLGRFDVVFCRNVLIYFTKETKRNILERIAGAMNPGGYLFVGSTESMSGCEDLFEMERHGLALTYRKR